MSLWNRKEMGPFAITSLAGILILAGARYLLKPSKIARLLEAPEPTEKEPYPFNVYAGGATLQTPFGRLRLYELGPKEGKKVLLIHGISNPSPVWNQIIPRLIDAGHRVLCYDLVGRGYSDGPSHLDYDASLYIGQLCMLLTSLPDWSGSFDVIGYSLGGVIATTFANYFPHRVDNLLLISPAGLIRSNKLPLLETLIDSRQLPISFAKSLISNGITSSKFLKRNTLVNWQISQHQGFIFSFTSTIANDMLFDLQELFQKVQDQFGDCMQAIWGDKDVTCPLDGAHYVHGLKVHIIKGGEHDMIAKAPFAGQIADIAIEALSVS